MVSSQLNYLKLNLPSSAAVPYCCFCSIWGGKKSKADEESSCLLEEVMLEVPCAQTKKHCDYLCHKMTWVNFDHIKNWVITIFCIFSNERYLLAGSSYPPSFLWDVNTACKQTRCDISGRSLLFPAVQEAGSRQEVCVVWR